MHTKRNRKHHYSRRRHCRSRRAGGLSNWLSGFSSSNGLPGTGKKLTSAINKVKDINKDKDIQFVTTVSFIGEMNIRTGQYIRGNFFYYERDGTWVGVRATNFNDRNRPCGIVTRIDLNGNTIMGENNNPIQANVTCDNSHVAEYPWIY